jgi:hypothetical protein
VVSAFEGRPTPSGIVFVDEGRGEVRLEVEAVGGRRGRDRSIHLRMRWQADDPLTVWIQVTARPDHPALPRGRWVVLRDFLRYGVEERTGDGDVQITPDPEGGVVHLDLALPRRSCRVSVPAALLDDFLSQTEQRVPLGAERSAEELEAFIAKLLH